MKLFAAPVIVALVVLIGMFVWGGVTAFLLTALLAVLETTLSFDNAVVNAKILARMSPVWQRRFLTWGILFAVAGTRLLLPILIVAAAVGISPLVIAQLALFDPGSYAAHLADAHVGIAAFGSAFLMLVSLKYFFDEAKTVHWIEIIEKHLSRWGRIEAIEIALVLAALLICAVAAPADASTLLIAGIIGVVMFVVIEGIANGFEIEPGTVVIGGGLALFVYLNVLDSAFSLDGVVGAFAITTSLPIIIAGLGIGALFVRTFTIAIVRAKSLDTLPYLEHGAHWAIFGLALSMLASIFVHVPEIITGSIGLIFIGLSYWSSRIVKI